jgi:hypothetical protein
MARHLALGAAASGSLDQFLVAGRRRLAAPRPRALFGGGAPVL